MELFKHRIIKILKKRQGVDTPFKMAHEAQPKNKSTGVSVC